ncbi:phospholipase A(1) LCAT3-like protein [Tanacetum coccineum]|uniref:Phospholipase A(1) LCAT3-like protein n=1 Tax=Tanacetum coccineum TaxID=301880 RepID=A0ABQ5FD01_9ASTR
MMIRRYQVDYGCFQFQITSIIRFKRFDGFYKSYQMNENLSPHPGLKERLETTYEAAGGRKVNIISHSMGGLSVTCSISLHYDVFVKYVKKWITNASPFQGICVSGAPGCINDSLLTGLQFVYQGSQCINR